MQIEEQERRQATAPRLISTNAQFHEMRAT
jgi:hypothetical protein